MTDNKIRILITRTDRIGDVMLSTPVIKAARYKYPDAHIAFCVQPHALELVDNNPYLNEVIAYDKKGRNKNLRGMVSFILDLRKRRFDMAIILHPTNRMHISCFLAGIPIRVGYDRKMGYLLTRRMPHTKQLGVKHEIEYNLDLARCIGMDTSDKRLVMNLREGVPDEVNAILAGHGISEDAVIVAIHPGAGCPSKRWPAGNFARVSRRLMDIFKIKVVIVGSNADRAAADAVMRDSGMRAADLTGRTSLSLLAGILSRSKLFISNDSGPVHIAVSVGTPVIAIFGRGDRGLSPQRWGPSGSMDVVLHKDVGCGVCMAHNCENDFKCLKAVTVQEVVEAAGRFL